MEYNKQLAPQTQQVLVIGLSNVFCVMFMCIYVCVCIFVYMNTYVCVYLYAYVCMYVCSPRSTKKKWVKRIWNNYWVIICVGDTEESSEYRGEWCVIKTLQKYQILYLISHTNSTSTASYISFIYEKSQEVLHGQSSKRNVKIGKRIEHRLLTEFPWMIFVLYQ